MDKGLKLVFTGIGLIMIGFLLVFLSTILSIPSTAPSVSSSNKTSGNVSGGIAGCIVIFFIPICFGTGSPGIVQWLVIITLVITILFLVVILLLARSFSSLIGASR